MQMMLEHRLSIHGVLYFFSVLKKILLFSGCARPLLLWVGFL